MDSKVAFQGQPGERLGLDLLEESEEEMARCLVKEYIDKKSSDSQILAIFRNPLSGGLHVFYKAKGEEWVQRLISQVRKGGGPVASAAEEGE